MAPDLLATFRRPFAEQVAAWQRRYANLVQTPAWDHRWQALHDQAFTVAGAMKADLLADLAAAVDKAITRGTTLEEFRRDFRRIVQERGWHGWTGEGSAKGEAWRTRVIYQTNLRTSYAAGRHAQLRAGGFAYWVYRHGGSREPRMHHLSWDRVALPVDHPFWVQHYPPNGWGCSCHVAGARTVAGIRRVGGDPDKLLPPGWDATNPRTGAQVGIDKGWGYAPGSPEASEATAGDAGFLAHKLATLPFELGQPLALSAQAPVRRGWSDWLERVNAGEEHRPGLVGAIGTDLSAELARRQLMPASAELLVRAELVLGRKATRHSAKGDALTSADWLALPEMLLAPQAVLLDVKTGRLLYILQSEDSRVPQLALDLSFRLREQRKNKMVNMFVSAYRPQLRDVRDRLRNGSLQYIMGTLG